MFVPESNIKKFCLVCCVRNFKKSFSYNFCNPVRPNDERDLTLSQHIFKFCFLRPELCKLEKLRNPWIFISNCVSGVYKSIIVCFILSGNVLKFSQNESRSNLNLTFHASEVSQQRAVVIDLGFWRAKLPGARSDVHGSWACFPSPKAAFRMVSQNGEKIPPWNSIFVFFENKYERQLFEHDNFFKKLGSD